MPKKEKRTLKGEGSHWEQADGTWRGYVTLPNTGGKRKYVSGKTEKQVIANKRRKLQEASDGLNMAADKITLGTYLDDWLKVAVEPARSPVTHRNYEVQVRLHIKSVLGHIRLQELTTQQIQGWITGRKGYGARAVRYSHTILHGALKQAVKWRMLVRNPAENVTLPRVPHVEMKYWTPPEARAFLEHVRGTRDECLYAIGVGLGLRRSELLGLTWAAVDLDKGTLSVKQTLQRLTGGLRMLEPKTKSSRRTLVLPRFIHNLLKVQRKMYLEQRMKAGARWQGDKWDTVFCNKWGVPIEPNRLATMFDKDAAAADLPRITVHGMRHTAATAMLSQGISPKVVSNILGHASVTITLELYAHVMPSDHQQVAEIMHTLYAS